MAYLLMRNDGIHDSAVHALPPDVLVRPQSNALITDRDATF